MYVAAFKPILCMHIEFVSHTNTLLVFGCKENKDYLVQHTSIFGTEITGHQYDMMMKIT